MENLLGLNLKEIELKLAVNNIIWVSVSWRYQPLDEEWYVMVSTAHHTRLD